MQPKSWQAIWRKRLRPFLGQVKYRAGAPWRALQRASVGPISWLHGGAAPAISRLHQQLPLTPYRVLSGYAQGIFVTGEPNGKFAWHCWKRT